MLSLLAKLWGAEGWTTFQRKQQLTCLLPAGAYHHGHVLLLWTCGAKWVWSLLQPTGREHPFLHLQLSRLQRDLLYQVFRRGGSKPPGNERPLQSIPRGPMQATCNKRKSSKAQSGPPTLTPGTRVHLPTMHSVASRPYEILACQS